MCGICGIIDWTGTLAHDRRNQTAKAMNETLLHRGPDASGYISDQNCSLGMRRLSIIDKEGGNQPVYNKERDICIFFNGEIYNYQPLRALLQEQGYEFSTRSDTEVLVHLYEEFRVGMLSKLRGMFCFCIYDIKNRTFFLARDSFGEKPLYYHWDKGIFSFSSEIKSLLRNPQINRKLNKAALPYYLRTSLVPEPITLLENIYSLQPGHYLLLDANAPVQKAFFKPSYEKTIKLESEKDAIDYIRPKLVSAVKRQMVSDVPIGAFLSGGIDSSSVVALMQQNSEQRIKTFNVRFEDQSFDESAIAKRVAEHVGTDHREIVIGNLEFDESIFWKIIDHVGFPFRDSSAIPSYMVSKEISKYVKVALSGDGGDELFAGYDLFQWYKKIIHFKSLPLPIRSSMNFGLGFAQKLPVLKQMSLLRRVKRGVSTSLLPLDEIPVALNEMFNRKQLGLLLNNTLANAELHKECFAMLKSYPEQIKSGSSLRKIMYYRLKHTLPVNMLVKVDRMSMANSLEVRSPFLDLDLFYASVQLPDHLLVKGGVGKYLLRKMMENDLPTEVFSHPKMGFSIPLHNYRNDAFQQLAKLLLFEENPWPELIPEDELRQIYEDGVREPLNAAQVSSFQAVHRLWMLMQLFGWAKHFKVKL